MTKRFERNRKGFTLMELLIVIAIIVILVAISIPIFTKQLEKARETTDIANMRAAKAAAATAYLSDETIGSTKLGDGQTADATLYYDADNGELKDAASGINAYGKGTTTTGNTANKQFGYDPSKAAADYVTVTVSTAGKITMSFNKASAAASN